jgi:hypothetical protein
VAAFSLLDVFTYVDGHDFTCDTNVAKLEANVAELNSTTFCSNGWTELTPGLKSVAFTMEGMWQAGTNQVDPEVFPTLGTTKTFTMGPVDTEGTVAYLWRAKDVKYELPRGSHGELAQFMINSVGADGNGLVRGQLAIAKQTISAAGQAGSVVTISTTSNSSYIYATHHTFTIGTSYSWVVESATNSSMLGATTVGTSASVSAVGATWLTRVAATSGRSYYRFRVTQNAGSHSIGGAIAVQ